MYLNLTDQQKDLLFLLVEKHESYGGVSFSLERSTTVLGLTYVGKFSTSLKVDVLDFQLLRGEGLISLIPSGLNQWTGRPTESGIEMIRRGFRYRRVMLDFERRCRLVSDMDRKQLLQKCELGEIVLGYLIEFAASIIRQRKGSIRYPEMKAGEDQPQTPSDHELARLRCNIVLVAGLVATKGVREFAAHLLSSQARLVINADWLRAYTAALIGGIRQWINSSEAFRQDPLPAWQSDPIAQQAIRACEEALIEREAEERAGIEEIETVVGITYYWTRGVESGEWAPIVQEWEALKSKGRQIGIVERSERIPEPDLLALVAAQYGINPESVTNEHIELAAVDLCRHYGRFEISPTSACTPQTEATVEPDRKLLADASFWKAREDEFRAHDLEDDRCLRATYRFPPGEWTLRNSRGGSLPAKLIETFKSIARDAAAGLGSDRRGDSWIYWLHVLRDAKDQESSKSLYSSSGPRYNLATEGEIDLSDAVTEFIGKKDGSVDRRTFRAITSVVIDDVFEKSAHLCRRFRSLAIPVSAPSRGTRPESESAPYAQARSATEVVEKSKLTRWQDLEIVFLSEHQIQMRINSELQPPLNYAEMDFASKKTDNPILAWETLRHLARHDGLYSITGNSREWPRIEKRIQEIRKLFRLRFGLSDDPIPFVKKTAQNLGNFGYRARFKIRCHLASGEGD